MLLMTINDCSVYYHKNMKVNSIDRKKKLQFIKIL